MANFKLTQTKEQIQADLDLLDKNTATAGQVLTANGTGGASWQNAASGGSGGGGTQLYLHSLLYAGMPTPGETYLSLYFISNTSTSLSISDLGTLKTAIFSLAKGADGYWSTYGNLYIFAVKCSSSALTFYGFDTSDNTTKSVVFSGSTAKYTDTATPL